MIRKERAGVALHIATAESSLLLDCGWGAPWQLVNAGVDPQRIDHILISHPHADHIGTLIPIVQSIYVTGNVYPERARSKPLYVHGYQGLARHYETLRDMMFPERVEPYETRVLEYPGNTQRIGDCTISAAEVRHVPEYFQAVAFRVESDGKSVVYSGDCAYDEALAVLSKDADVAVYEASISVKRYRTQGPGKTHLSPVECGLIAAKAGVSRLVLVHLYDNSTEQEIIDAVRANFQGEFIISRDLQEIAV